MGNWTQILYDIHLNYYAPFFVHIDVGHSSKVLHSKYMAVYYV